MINVSLQNEVEEELLLLLVNANQDSSCDGGGDDEGPMHDMIRPDAQVSREDASVLSLPVLPTVDPAEVHVSSGGAASSSGLPIGPGR